MPIALTNTGTNALKSFSSRSYFYAISPVQLLIFTCFPCFTATLRSFALQWIRPFLSSSLVSYSGNLFHSDQCIHAYWRRSTLQPIHLLRIQFPRRHAARPGSEVQYLYSYWSEGPTEALNSSHIPHRSQVIRPSSLIQLDTSLLVSPQGYSLGLTYLDARPLSREE